VVTPLVFDPVPSLEATRFELIWPRQGAAPATMPYRDLKRSLGTLGAMQPSKANPLRSSR
jgi:hypothetical protein